MSVPTAAIPAPAAPARIELRFGPAPHLRRQLYVDFGSLGIAAWLYGARGPLRSRMLVYASERIERCRLYRAERGSVLYVGSAHFDATDHEAAQILAALAPHGLKEQP